MATRLPLLHKTPFELDPRPLAEATSAHAGLLALSRAFRALRLPGQIEANLRLKQRLRGFTEGQMVETALLLHGVGAECPEDIKVFAGDACLERGLGYALPKATACRSFLDRFHDESLEELRPPRAEQKSFILPSSAPVAALQQVLAGAVRQIALRQAQRGGIQSIATLDQDATLIESHKQAARAHYEGGRGYQPMVAVWAELDLVVADEFRDGNVPARQEPLTCAQMAFAALPASVTQRYFRGDSACHEAGLLNWLKHPDRAQEPGGRIGFAVSASMGLGLAAAVRQVEEKAWKTVATEADGTQRQWAEVTYVPTETGEKKESQPLRYVGVRLLKTQGVLFADGSDRHHHAVLTNLDWEGGRLLNWHREKAGTIEHVHDEIKNHTGGGHLPSQHFAANAAWFKLALLTYNVISAIRGLCFEPVDRVMRLKNFRLCVIQVAGRMSRFGCVERLRLRATPEVIQRVQKIWEVFALPTQATAAKALG